MANYRYDFDEFKVPYYNLMEGVEHMVDGFAEFIEKICPGESYLKPQVGKLLDKFEELNKKLHVDDVALAELTNVDPDSDSEENSVIRYRQLSKMGNFEEAEKILDIDLSNVFKEKSRTKKVIEKAMQKGQQLNLPKIAALRKMLSMEKPSTSSADGDIIEDHDEIEVSVKYSRKDPITKQDILNPFMNKHVYDKDSIEDYIRVNRAAKKLVQCPVPGCPNKKLLIMDDIVAFPAFFELINQQETGESDEEL